MYLTAAEHTILEAYSEVLGPDHPHVSVSLGNLAILYDTEGEYANAEALYSVR
jgi:hypothetical protein